MHVVTAYIGRIAWQVRVILDTYGGQAVKVLPCPPAMLHTRVSDGLKAPEPDWDKPAPQAWLSGSSWGSQRTILFSGLKYAPAASLVLHSSNILQLLLRLPAQYPLLWSLICACNPALHSLQALQLL